MLVRLDLLPFCKLNYNHYNQDNVINRLFTMRYKVSAVI